MICSNLLKMIEQVDEWELTCTSECFPSEIGAMFSDWRHRVHVFTRCYHLWKRIGHSPATFIWHLLMKIKLEYFHSFVSAEKNIKMILIAFKWKHIEFDFDFRFNVEYFPSILPSWMPSGISVRIENSITNRKFLFKFGETNLWHKIVLPPSGSMWAEVILWQTFILRVVLLSIKLYMNIIIPEWFGCVQSVQR